MRWDSWKGNRREPALCVCGDHAWVAMTRGFVTLVSPEDAGLLWSNNWTTFPTRGLVYARRNLRAGKKSRTIFLHREVMAAGKEYVDHKNGNGWDNRRQNLRLATPSQNGANAKQRGRTSSFKGVYWASREGRWVACIRDGGKSKQLGYFKSEELAHEAYVRAAIRIYGEFARVA